MEPTSGRTIRLEEHYTLSDERTNEVFAASRKNYARKYEEPKTAKATKKDTVKKSESKEKPANKFKGGSIGSGGLR